MSSGAPAEPARVLVVGAGLVGTSIGLGLRPGGTDVLLADASPTVAAVAADLGAGRRAPALELAGPEDEPDLVVVAAPPDVTARLVVEHLRRWPRAVVTDVASTKQAVVAEVLRLAGDDAGRYVGGHPMAGRERSGPMAARGDLFVGRPWVLTPVEGTRVASKALVREAATRLGAVVVELDPASHDEAVALVSHLPQVAASLVAARLVGAPASAVALAGQGLRDVTRIAASDPHLWTQILAGNAAAVREVLLALVADLDRVVGALEALSTSTDAPGARGTLATAIAAGNAGHARIPGKHGAAPTAYATVRVLIPDEPGQLGRLFADIGAIGTNIEEFHLDHGLGQPFGLAEVDVVPAAAAGLALALEQRGWRLHG